MTKILVSIETKESLELVPRIADYVDGFKINHLLWDEHPLPLPKDWAKYRKKELFVDFKLWDTPNTVEAVTKKIIDRGGTMVSISTHNNNEVFWRLKMLIPKIKLVGVSSLTSWNHDQERLILGRTADVMWNTNLNRIRRFGFTHVVCSVPDLRFIKSIDQLPPNNFQYICPGIRTKENKDLNAYLNTGQTRIGTPEEAKKEGADYIVLGRTVTKAENPNEVLVNIKGSL